MKYTDVRGELINCILLINFEVVGGLKDFHPSSTKLNNPVAWIACMVTWYWNKELVLIVQTG